MVQYLIFFPSAWWGKQFVSELNRVSNSERTLNIRQRTENDGSKASEAATN